MSYVLDALKKSDQERQRRTTPGINSVHGTVEQQHKSRILWPYLLILVLLLNAGLLLWWINPFQSGKPSLVSQESSAQEETAAGVDQPEWEGPSNPLHVAARRAKQSNLNTPELRESKSRLPMPAETAPLHRTTESRAVDRPQVPSQSSGPEEPAAIQNKSAPKSDVEKSSESESGENTQFSADKAPFSETIKKNAAKPGNVGSGSASAQKKASVPLAVDLLLERLQDLRATPGKEGAGKAQIKSETLKSNASQENQDTASRDTQPPVNQSVATDTERNSIEDSDSEPERGIPQLHELPPPIRREVPSLSFSMLVYSRNPAERIVRINGQVVHEGQEVSAGLKLEHITPNGAIFSYRGYRFHKGVL